MCGAGGVHHGRHARTGRRGQDAQEQHRLQGDGERDDFAHRHDVERPLRRGRREDGSLRSQGRHAQCLRRPRERHDERRRGHPPQRRLDADCHRRRHAQRERRQRGERCRWRRLALQLRLGRKRGCRGEQHRLHGRRPRRCRRRRSGGCHRRCRRRWRQRRQWRRWLPCQDNI